LLTHFEKKCSFAVKYSVRNKMNQRHILNQVKYTPYQPVLDARTDADLNNSLLNYPLLQQRELDQTILFVESEKDGVYEYKIVSPFLFKMGDKEGTELKRNVLIDHLSHSIDRRSEPERNYYNTFESTVTMVPKIVAAVPQKSVEQPQQPGTPSQPPKK
jgi:hypothetical protein